MNTAKDVTDAVEGALEAAERGGDKAPDRVTLSNGIVLGLKPIPPMLVSDALSRITRPVPPTVHDDDRDIDIDNLGHPDYIAALDTFEAATSEAASSVFLAAGTFPISAPAGYFLPEDDDWIELTRFLGTEVSVDNKYARYMSWLRYHALAKLEDYQTVLVAVAAQAGATEEEVQAAARTFRSGAVRRADRNGASEADTDGDNDSGDSPVSDITPRRARRSTV